MDEFFELLNKENLSSRKFAAQVQRWSVSDIYDFVYEASELLPEVKQATPSPFDFVANTQLSGGTHPCAEIECRLHNADALARLAALYAERVLIRNPFEEYFDTDLDEDFIKTNVINDLRIIYHFKPLIDAGIVGFSKPVCHFCKQCYRKHTGEPLEFDAKVDRAKRTLQQRFLKEATFTFMPEFGSIEIDAPDHLTHTFGITFDTLPVVLQRYIESVKPHTLSRKEAIDAGVVNHFVAPIIDDLLVQNWYSNQYGSNYLTDRQLDFDILSATNTREVDLQSKALLEGLPHHVPFVEDVELEKLLKLREHEGASFQVYRDAVASALKSINTFDKKEVRRVFDDIIRPEINNIELAFENSRKQLWGSLKHDVLFYAGCISVGLYGGILQSDLSQIVTALGGTAAALDLSRKSSSLMYDPIEVKNNKYYFLWKVRRTLQRSGKYQKRRRSS